MLRGVSETKSLPGACVCVRERREGGEEGERRVAVAAGGGRLGGGLLAMGGRERGDSCFLFFLPAQSRLIFSKQYQVPDELLSQLSSPAMDLPGKRPLPSPPAAPFAKHHFKH